MLTFTLLWDRIKVKSAVCTRFAKWSISVTPSVIQSAVHSKGVRVCYTGIGLHVRMPRDTLQALKWSIERILWQIVMLSCTLNVTLTLTLTWIQMMSDGKNELGVYGWCLCTPIKVCRVLIHYCLSRVVCSSFASAGCFGNPLVHENEQLRNPILP